MIGFSLPIHCNDSETIVK